MECFWNCVFLSELENLQGNRTENNKKKHLLPHVHSISISRFSVNNPLSSPVYPFFLLLTALNLSKQKLKGIVKLYYDAIYYIYTYTYTISWTYWLNFQNNKQNKTVSITFAASRMILGEICTSCTYVFLQQTQVAKSTTVRAADLLFIRRAIFFTNAVKLARSIGFAVTVVFADNISTWIKV